MRRGTMVCELSCLLKCLKNSRVSFQKPQPRSRVPTSQDRKVRPGPWAEGMTARRGRREGSSHREPHRGHSLGTRRAPGTWPVEGSLSFGPLTLLLWSSRPLETREGTAAASRTGGVFLVTLVYGKDVFVQLSVLPKMRRRGKLPNATTLESIRKT